MMTLKVPDLGTTQLLPCLSASLEIGRTLHPTRAQHNAAFAENKTERLTDTENQPIATRREGAAVWVKKVKKNKRS